jgi:hypothetical protein
MPQKSKLQKEYQVEDDGTTVIPKEIIPQIAPTVLKKTVKRERTDAQKANFAKVVEANKERWAKLRADKDGMAAQAKQAIKDDHLEKIEAGTHVRVMVKEKRYQQPRQRQEPVEEESEEEVIVVKKSKPKKRIVYESETDTPTDTDDTDYEDYKHGKREIRREVKKNMKAIERIDSVVQATTRNPYTAMFESRWK